jgi:hypothetical protein
MSSDQRPRCCVLPSEHAPDASMCAYAASRVLRAVQLFILPPPTTCSTRPADFFWPRLLLRSMLAREREHTTCAATTVRGPLFFWPCTAFGNYL